MEKNLDILLCLFFHPNKTVDLGFAYAMSSS